MPLPKRATLRPGRLLPLLLLALAFLLLSPSQAASSIIRLPSEQQQQQPDNPGPCEVTAATARPASCPVRCFRPDPVCGADGVTYWCGCADAACSGARVVKVGYCQDNGAEMRVSGQALLLVHTVWLFVLGFSLAFGLF